MSPLVSRGLAELFYGCPTLTAYDRQLPVNGRMAVIPSNPETEAEMLLRLSADRHRPLLN
jgi:hypothetical protein